MSDLPIRVYIGYDRREDIAYKVCQESIYRSSPNVRIIPLIQDLLRINGMYCRAHDALASTDFSLTRFCIPQLEDKGWVMYCDCDFLFTRDLHELFNLIDDAKAVMVVPHDYTPSETLKMDDQQQTIYYRKNWSSLILFNCAHPANRNIPVNDETPAFLHRFGWLNDNDIGHLPLDWNFLVGVYEKPELVPAGIHFTNGGPWLDKYKDCDYAVLWNYLEEVV